MLGAAGVLGTVAKRVWRWPRWEIRCRSDAEVLGGEDGAGGAMVLAQGRSLGLVVCGDGRVVLVQIALAVDHKLLAVGVAAAHDAVAAQVLPH